jgi:hypothetical protein
MIGLHIATLRDDEIKKIERVILEDRRLTCDQTKFEKAQPIQNKGASSDMEHRIICTLF